MCGHAYIQVDALRICATCYRVAEDRTALDDMLVKAVTSVMASSKAWRSFSSGGRLEGFD